MDESTEYILHDLVGDDRFYEEVSANLEYPNEIDELGYTLLHAAAWSKENNSRIMQLLLDNGADVNDITLYGHTPLHFAVANRKRDAVVALIEAGASINTKGFLGRTALHFAIGATWSYPTVPVISNACDNWIVERLLCHPEIHVNPVDGVRNTPLMWAVKERNLHVVKLLLKKGADPNISNVNNRYPLHKALSPRNPSYPIVFALLTNGAGIYCEDKFGQTPMDILIRHISDASKPLFSERYAWMRYRIKESPRRRMEKLPILSRGLFAKHIVWLIALRYHIKDSLWRKLEKIPVLYNHLARCCKEVKLMRRQMIHGNFTLHDFASECFWIQVDDPVQNIYTPVVSILLSGSYIEYFDLILHQISKIDLHRVLTRMAGGLVNGLPHPDDSHSAIFDAIKNFNDGNFARM